MMAHGQIIRFLYVQRDNFLFCQINGERTFYLANYIVTLKGTFILFGYQILLTLALYTQVRFYGLAITARALSLLRQGHKRDMQSSHEYVLLPYTRAPHLRRIYRTLMHNALRDDGKYGYITHQRPMLFSLASHWLMLIRNQRPKPQTLATKTTDVH